MRLEIWWLLEPCISIFTYYWLENHSVFALDNMVFWYNFYFRRRIKAFYFGSADKRALAVCVLDESLVTVCCNNDCSFTIMEHASLGATFTSNTRQMNSPLSSLLRRCAKLEAKNVNATTNPNTCLASMKWIRTLKYENPQTHQNLLCLNILSKLKLRLHQ